MNLSDELAALESAVFSTAGDTDKKVADSKKRDDVSATTKVHRRRITFNKLKANQIRNFKEIGFPESGDAVCMMATGSFNAYAIILHAIEEFGCLDSLSVTSYNMHQEVISSIFDNLNDGKIKKLEIILSKSVEFRVPKRFRQMADLYKKHKHLDVRVKYNWNHSKITLIEAGENNFCISGSGNLSDNAQFEQYYITNNLEDYLLFKEWMNDEFRSINRETELIL